MSAGTANPTTWPRWRLPAAYGQAGATRIFRLLLVFANRLLRLGEGHDTSRLWTAPATAGYEKTRAERQKDEPERDEQVPARFRPPDAGLVRHLVHRRAVRRTALQMEERPAKRASGRTSVARQEKAPPASLLRPGDGHRPSRVSTQGLAGRGADLLVACDRLV